MNVKIMIDSAGDITALECKKLGLLHMPLEIRFDEETFLDGQTLTSKEFYEKLEKSRELPQTSMINSFRWSEAFEEATKDGSELVVITISSKLSGTHLAASEAALGFKDKVFVVDSLSASFGEGALGILALNLKNQGLSAKEIAHVLEQKKSKVHAYAGIDTLKYLKKGGRISATSAILGTTLSIKPIVGMVDGTVQVVTKAVGSKKATLSLHSIIKNFGGYDENMPFAYIYSGAQTTRIEKFIEETSHIFPKDKTPIYPIGSTIGTHLGPNAVGFVFFEK